MRQPMYAINYTSPSIIMQCWATSCRHLDNRTDRVANVFHNEHITEKMQNCAQNVIQSIIYGIQSKILYKNSIWIKNNCLCFYV